MDTMPHILGFSFTGKYYLNFPNKCIIEKIDPKDLPIGIIFDESIPSKIRKELCNGLTEYYQGPRMFYYNRKLSYETPFDELIDFRDAYILKVVHSQNVLTKSDFPIMISKDSLIPYFGTDILSYNIDGKEYVYFALYRVQKTKGDMI